MVTRVLHSYFLGLQSFYNPFGIYFDTFYSFNLDLLKKYSSSFRLSQVLDLEKLKSAQITEDLLNSLRNPRPDGLGCYNAIQYKFSPLKRTDLHPNNEFYYIIYYSNGEVAQLDSKRNFRELDRAMELHLMEDYADFLKGQPNSPIKETLHDAIIGDIDPKLETDKTKQIAYQRLGVYCDIELECRFLTTNTSIFEDFQILYNAMLCDRNPPVFMELKHAKDLKYPITTRYNEIDSAERLDPEKFGSLMMVGFSVTLTSMFLSSYVKKSSPVNRVGVFTEIQPKTKLN